MNDDNYDAGDMDLQSSSEDDFNARDTNDNLEIDFSVPQDGLLQDDFPQS